MRTRARSRRAGLDPPPEPMPFPDAPPEPMPFPDAPPSLWSEPVSPPARPPRRRGPPARRSRPSSAAAVAAPAPRPPRSDVVLRNIALLAVVAAVTLTFLNLFLYAAIFAVGLLAPAWQTFKALEARDAARAAPVVVEVSDDEQYDELDEEYLPPGLTRPQPRPPRPPPDDQLQATDALVRNWQTYWVMAAMLFAADGLVLAPFIARLLPKPLYAAGLFSAVSWLTRNRGGNAYALYTAVVRPAFLRSERAIDRAVEGVLTQVDAVSHHAVVKVNEIVAPYARQLEHAATMTRQQLQEQANGRFRREFKPRRFLS